MNLKNGFMNREKIQQRFDACWLTRLLTSHACLAFVYGIFLFLYELKFFRDMVSAVHPVLIAWACALFVYDVVVRHIWKKLPYWKLLALFVVSAGVTALLNRETGLVSNVKSLVMVALPLFAFYPVCLVADKQKRKKILFSVFLGAATVVLLASSYAVGTYLMRYTKTVLINDVEEIIGVLFWTLDTEQTIVILYGLYTDSNHAAIYALLFAVYSIALFGACLKGLYGKKWLNVLGCVFAAVNFLVQICFFPLANSRGGWLSLLVAVFAVVFLYLYCQGFAKRKFPVKAVLSLALAVVCTAAMYFGLTQLRTGLSRASVMLTTKPSVEVTEPSTQTATTTPSTQATTSAPTTEPTTQPTKAPTVAPTLPPPDDFAKPEGDTGSGRLELWRDALQLFVKKPVMGIGPGNSQYYALKYDTAKWGIIYGMDIHNSYLNLLVGYGVVGALFMIAFWALCLFAVLKRMFTRDSRCSGTYYLVALCVLLISGAAALLSCVFITTSAMYYIMLIMTGYLLSHQNDSV